MGSRALKAYALRDIQEGEELTIDYSIIEADADFMFENNEHKHEKYRQYIGSIQTLSPEVFHSYLPFIPSYFKKIYQKEVLLKNGTESK